MDLFWTDFLNTDYHDWRGSGRNEDRLTAPQRLRQLLDCWKLDAPVPPSREELEKLRVCRANLRRIAEYAADGAPVTPADADLLNRLMAEGLSVRALTAAEDGAYHLELRPAGGGWKQVMAEAAASFAKTLTEGDPSRIRICGNPDCLWVFYDETRSRTKRYCEDSMCGNLMKVRRFRAKRKGTET